MLLGDPYSTYMNAKENQELFQMLKGKFGGVGIVLSLKDPKKLVVLSPLRILQLVRQVFNRVTSSVRLMMLRPPVWIKKKQWIAARRSWNESKLNSLYGRALIRPSQSV